MSAYCLSSKIKRTKMCNYTNKSSTTDTCFSTAQTTVFLGYSTIHIACSKGSSSAEGRFCTSCVHGHAVNRVGITVCQCFSTGVLAVSKASAEPKASANGIQGFLWIKSRYRNYTAFEATGHVFFVRSGLDPNTTGELTVGRCVVTDLNVSSVCCIYVCR